MQDEETKSRLEKELAALKSKLDKANAAASKVEATIAGIEEAIENVGGIKLKAQKAKVSADAPPSVRRPACRLLPPHF